MISSCCGKYKWLSSVGHKSRCFADCSCWPLQYSGNKWEHSWAQKSTQNVAHMTHAFCCKSSEVIWCKFAFINLADLQIRNITSYNSPVSYYIVRKVLILLTGGSIIVNYGLIFCNGLKLKRFNDRFDKHAAFQFRRN